MKIIPLSERKACFAYDDEKIEVPKISVWGAHLRRRVTTDFDPDVEPSLTKQAPTDETDINNIMKQFGFNNVASSEWMQNPNLYGDYSNPMSFLEAQNVLLTAEAQFAGLPSHIRDRFKNDPIQFLEFVSDDKNKDEAEKLGLLREKVAPPSPVRVIVENVDKPKSDA